MSMDDISHFEIFTGALGILIAVTIFYLIRKDQMHVRFSLWWIFVASLAVLFGFFPRLFDVIGEFLGVSYPPILVVILAVAALVIKILLADLERSTMRRDMLRLTQRLLLVEHDLKRLKRNSRQSITDSDAPKGTG